MTRIPLRTIDSQEIEFDCDDGQWVLDAAAGAGYTLPSLCSKGTCGGCFAQVVEGDYELGPHEDAALPRRGGAVVAGVCCCVAPRRTAPSRSICPTTGPASSTASSPCGRPPS